MRYITLVAVLLVSGCSLLGIGETDLDGRWFGQRVGQNPDAPVFYEMSLAEEDGEVSGQGYVTQYDDTLRFVVHGTTDGETVILHLDDQHGWETRYKAEVGDDRMEGEIRGSSVTDTLVLKKTSD